MSAERSRHRFATTRWSLVLIGAQLESAFPTSGFAEVFARRTDLKLVLDKDKLRELIAAGVTGDVVGTLVIPEPAARDTATRADTLGRDTTRTGRDSVPPKPVPAKPAPAKPTPAKPAPTKPAPAKPKPTPPQ